MILSLSELSEPDIQHFQSFLFSHFTLIDTHLEKLKSFVLEAPQSRGPAFVKSMTQVQGVCACVRTLYVCYVFVCLSVCTVFIQIIIILLPTFAAVHTLFLFSVCVHVHCIIISVFVLSLGLRRFPQGFHCSLQSTEDWGDYCTCTCTYYVEEFLFVWGWV